jgi:hypothetical protein
MFIDYVGESGFDGLPDDVDSARVNCEYNGDLGWVVSELGCTLNENRANPPTRGWSTTSPIGARSKGMALFAGATTQAWFALDNLRNDDGLFVAASRFKDGQTVTDDDSVDVTDQF